MKHRAHWQNNIRYGFDHIKPIKIDHNLDIGIVRLHIIFSHHCFTKDRTAKSMPESIYQYANEKREFCPIRYELSKHLPHIINQMQGSFIFKAKRNSSFVVKMMDINNQPIKYRIFFNIKPSTRNDADLQIVVTTAFPGGKMDEYGISYSFSDYIKEKYLNGGYQATSINQRILYLNNS